MITLYLDHQIYSYLKSKDDPTKFQGEEGVKRMETVIKLHDFLIKQKNNFLIFYSHAHLLDLSSDKSGNKERLLEDLEFRAGWAENNYLTFNERENSSDYELAFPKEKFEPYWEDDEDIDFSNFLDLSGLEGLIDNEKLEQLKEQKLLLENLKFPSIDDLIPKGNNQNQDEDYQKMKDILSFMNGGTFIDLIKGVTDFTNKFQEEKGFYKGIRNVVTSGIQKSKNKIIPLSDSPEAKFIFDLANIDLNSPEKEVFVKENLLTLVRKQLAYRNKDKEPTIFDLHYESYVMLDMMGIEKEKATIARNMLNDAQHSFYGGHCEIVISEDKQFRAKSKLLYKLFGLSTQVLTIEEFMSQSFSIELEDVNSISDLMLRTKYDLNTGFISSSRISTMLNQVKEIKPTMKYFHYFNQLLLINEDGKDALIFRHKVQTYLKQLPYKVIEGITEKATQLFGLDNERKGFYKWEEENDDIRKGNWSGRNWNLGESQIMLQISPIGNNLQLVIV